LLHHQIEDVRHALTISSSVPIMACDARERDSAKQVLISVVQHAIEQEKAVAAG
jgi:signal recognition particle receptor subunit beta